MLNTGRLLGSILYAVEARERAEHRGRDTFDRLASEHRDGELRVIPGYGSPGIAHSGRTERDSQIICTSGLCRLVQAYCTRRTHEVRAYLH